MRNSGKWTEAKFNSFVKSTLRSGSRKWPPKYEVINEAFVGVKQNEQTGRQAKHFQCAICAGTFPASKIQVDHIEPIIDPTIGFVSWDETINRMFCEKENLQVLCLECHAIKTKEEKSKRTSGKNLGTQKKNGKASTDENDGA